MIKKRFFRVWGSLVLAAVFPGAARPATQVDVVPAPSGEQTAVVLFVSHPATVRDAALFIRSIRRFGGVMKDVPIHVMNDAQARLDVERLKAPNVEIHEVEMNPAHRSFPFAPKVFACAAAEKHLAGRVSTLLYFDTEMIAFSSFDKLLMPDDRSVSFVRLCCSIASAKRPTSPWMITGSRSMRSWASTPPPSPQSARTSMKKISVFTSIAR